jgi:hypothetical protein
METEQVTAALFLALAVILLAAGVSAPAPVPETHKPSHHIHKKRSNLRRFPCLIEEVAHVHCDMR